MDFHLDGTRQGMLVHDGFVKQVNMSSVSLTNGDPCGKK